MWPNILLLLLISFPAWCYRFTSDFTNGFYWQSLPISIVVSETDPARKKLLEDLSKTAIAEWEDKTGLKLWSYKDGTPNIIRWSTNFAAETRMDPSTVLAVAIRYTSWAYFARTEIVINGNHFLNQSEAHLRTTITHELGHTMGLDHSEVGAAVMAPTLQPVYFGLHEDDRQGLEAAYAEMDRRQATGYVTSLAYQKEETQKQPLSCGTTAPVGTSGNAMNGLLSIAGGFLISLVRRLIRWFKSLL